MKKEIKEGRKENLSMSESYAIAIMIGRDMGYNLALSDLLQAIKNLPK